MIKQESSDFTYKIYYSSLTDQPSEEDHEMSWDHTAKTFKIYDETSKTKNFVKKKLNFSVMSNYKAVLKLTGKFYNVNTKRLKEFQLKKKMSVFDAFKKRHRLTDHEIRRAFERSKSKI